MTMQSSCRRRSGADSLSRNWRFLREGTVAALCSEFDSEKCVLSGVSEEVCLLRVSGWITLEYSGFCGSDAVCVCYCVCVSEQHVAKPVGACHAQFTAADVLSTLAVSVLGRTKRFPVMLASKTSSGSSRSGILCHTTAAAPLQRVCPLRD